MKTFKILTIAFLIIIILSGKVLAWDTIFSQAGNWIETGESNKDGKIRTSNLRDASNDIYNILLAVGTGVAVIVGAILGIKYMTAGIEDKVKVKESLIPYLISCIILFGTFGIWKLAVTITKQVDTVSVQASSGGSVEEAISQASRTRTIQNGGNGSGSGTTQQSSSGANSGGGSTTQQSSSGATHGGGGTSGGGF